MDREEYKFASKSGDECKAIVLGFGRGEYEAIVWSECGRRIGTCTQFLGAPTVEDLTEAYEESELKEG